MKTVQVLKMEHGLHRYHVVLHLDASTNPYWVYADPYNYETLGFSHKLIAKYADFISVMYFLTHCVQNGGVPDNKAR